MIGYRDDWVMDCIQCEFSLSLVSVMVMVGRKI